MNVQRRSAFSLAYYILGLNILVFFLTSISPRLISYLALSPVTLLAGGFVWTPLTYMFVHGSFTHLLFNSIFLIFTGPAVEEQMGRREFFWYYIISGVLAGLFSVFSYLAAGQLNPIVGASGALYAVLLAFATYYPGARFLVFFVLPIRAPHALALFALIDLVSHWRSASGGVAHLTHLSGLVFGYLYFLIRLRINPIKRMRNRFW